MAENCAKDATKRRLATRLARGGLTRNPYALDRNASARTPGHVSRGAERRPVKQSSHGRGPGVVSSPVGRPSGPRT